MIKKGDEVYGVDLYGKKIIGTVENIMKIFNMAQVRFSKDKLGITTCSIFDLEIVKDK